MTTNQDVAAVEATVAQEVWRDAFGEVKSLVAGCFPRRVTRQTFTEMTEAMLMGVERANCWTLAEALGHPGRHRLQHFLVRAVWDHDAVRDRAARWAAQQLVDDQAVLVADETGDEKSSTEAVGAARQHSGALGGIGLCQVAVHLAYAKGHGFLLVRRHRYTRETSFSRCHSAAPIGLADLVAVVCTRWWIEEDIRAAKSLAALDQGQVTCWNSWMRWSLISLVAAALLAVALARTCPAGPTPAPDLIPLARPELLVLLRAAVLPAPRRDLAHVLHWSCWRRRHQHRAAACHQRWNETTAATAT